MSTPKPQHSREMQEALELAISVAIQTNDLAEGPVSFTDTCLQARRARVITAASLCCVVFEHQTAITFLVDNHRRTSAFALMRPLFDAFWRALWVGFVATEDEVERFRNGPYDPKFETASKKLDSIPGFPPMFRALARQSWKTMSAYTHSSGLVTQRYFRDNAITPAHPDDETIQLIHQAGWFALACGVVLSNVLERDVEPFNNALAMYVSQTS